MPQIAFEWAGFSRKQRQVLTWWRPDSPFNEKTDIVIEGAVRSGKTASASFSFLCWAMDTFDGEEFAFSGKTIGTAIRNVINPLKKIMDSEEAFEYVIHRSSTEGYHIDVQLDSHQNIFWVFGGKDESSQDLIQGKTLAGVLFDEVLLMPRSFVVQAQARTSVDGAVNWYTLNPDSPNHEFYTEAMTQMEASGSLFYLHMTFSDNPSLSAKTIARFTSMWPRNSVFYRRYVLGERCAAEGAIYPFDWTRPDTPGCPVVSRLPDQFSIFMVAVDYGSRNDFHALLLGLRGGVWYAVKEYVWSGRTQGGRPPSKYVDDLARLCEWGGREITPVSVVVDPSAAGFIDEISTSKYPQLHNVRGANNDVTRGIENLMSMLHSGQFKIFSGCSATVRSLSNLVWDEKAAKNGTEKQVKNDDHGCLVGDTIIETARGKVQLKDVVEGDYVQTRTGYHRVTFSGMTHIKSKIYHIGFDNGAELFGTSNHPILDYNKRFIPLDTFRYGDMVWSLKRVPTEGELTEDIQTQKTGAQKSISGDITAQDRRNIFTARYGKNTMALFQRGLRSITRTGTQLITTYQIWKQSQKVNTIRRTQNNAAEDPNTLKTPSFWRRSDLWLRFGIDPRRGANGTENTRKHQYWSKDHIKRNATFAGWISPRKQISRGFAQINANPHGGDASGLMMKRGSVRCVGPDLGLTSMNQPKPALKSVRVISPAEPSGQTAPTYNLTVEGANEFFANGILVHNSDAARYGALEAGFYVGRRG